jgi:hypothetical protein
VIGYRVPFGMKGLPVTNHFIRRSAEMSQLEKFFGSDVNVNRKRQKGFVVYGLGGMGRTQVYVEYVRQHKEDFTAVFWLDGSSKDALRQSLANAAARLPEGLSSAGRLSPDAYDTDWSIEALN